MDGLRLATTLDLPVRVGMTATAPEAELLRALLAGMGITGKDFAGDARSWPGGPPPRASVIEDTNTVPEIAVTADWGALAPGRRRSRHEP